MPQSIKEHLKSLFLSLQSTLAEPREDSILETIEPRFKQLMSKFNSEVITYCIEKYIKAELNYTTPISRGIGRTIAEIPNFGAYVGKPLSILSKQDMDKLNFLIKDICLRGYLMSALLVEWPARNDKLSDKDLLFEEWLHYIYVIKTRKSMDDINPFVVNPYILNIDPDILDILKLNILPTILEIRYFMRQHGTDKDSLLTRVSNFFSGNKVSEILECDAIVGYSLRAVEEGWY